MARQGFEVDYRNVKKHPAQLEEMLKLSGSREVPVIVQGGKVTIGWQGFT